MDQSINIEIEFIGFPTIYGIFHGNSQKYAFQGETLLDLIENLIEQNGDQLKECLLYQPTRTLDPAIQIIINQKYIGKERIYHQRIKEVGKITFLKLLAGG
jgi:hypothetical protein